MAEERTKKIENNKGEDDKDMDTGYSWIILLGEFNYLYIHVLIILYDFSQFML